MPARAPTKPDGEPEAGPLPVDEERYARVYDLARRAPSPARFGSLFFGTAGWTDPSLTKTRAFYPATVRTPEARLRYYATQFSLVEVDGTYYALPTPEQAGLWVERTPPGFVFDIKAFAALTGHPVDTARLPVDLRAALPAHLQSRARVHTKDLPSELVRACFERFDRALDPLAAAGRLGSVLLQFPPWFEATRGNARALEAVRELLPGRSLAVEFRHRSWAEPSRWPRVLDLLRAHRMHLVVVDAPQGHSNSMPPRVAVADPARSVVRFHGRRVETWNAPDAGVTARFDYLYDPSELGEWVEALRRLGAESQEVHAVFNNCVRDYAVVDAKALATLCERAAIEATRAAAG